MALYRYEALDAAGTRVEGVLEGENEFELYRALRRRGLRLVRARPQRFRERLSPRALAELSRNLYYLIGAGVPLLQGLQELAGQAHSPGYRRVLEGLVREVEAGGSLSEAMGRFPRTFPSWYVSIVRAGESSGNLERALGDLARWLEWIIGLRSRMRQVLTYPALVMALVSVALCIFVLLVIPRLVRFLQELSVPLPLPTRLLVAATGWSSRHWFLLWLPPACAAALALLSSRLERLRRARDAVLLRLPYLGPLALRIASLRFVSYLEVLYRSGIQVHQAMEMLRDLVGNRVLRERVAGAHRGLLEGRSLSEALDGVDFPSPLIRRAIRVGERSGTLDQVLRQQARQLEEEVDRDLQRLTSLIEPLTLMVVGGIVLLLAGSVLWPLYGLLGKLG